MGTGRFVTCTKYVNPESDKKLQYFFSFTFLAEFLKQLHDFPTLYTNMYVLSIACTKENFLSHVTRWPSWISWQTAKNL